ncbi:MAG: nuclear transport factor 2 family protein [Thermodesulfovibrionales bacterium]|jgi:ketosteroid isomerase-like protein
MKADARTEGEIMAMLRDFTDAYEKRDMERLLSCFAPDPDVMIIGTGPDEKRVGPGEIRAQVERDWQQSESVRLEFGRTSISASGSIAWVAADLTFHAQAEGKRIVMTGRLTAVLEKRGDRWLWMLSHFSVPAGGQAEGESFPGE